MCCEFCQDGSYRRIENDLEQANAELDRLCEVEYELNALQGAVLRNCTLSRHTWEDAGSFCTVCGISRSLALPPVDPYQPGAIW